MKKNRKSIKAEVAARLLEQVGKKIPTSSMGRIGRAAVSVFRGGKMVLFNKPGRFDDDEKEIDIDKIVALVNSVGQLKGIAMKMGQILSYIDVAIPEELKDALSVLQTHAQSMPFFEVASLLNAELGDKAKELLKHMEETPISAASIGQVHKARLEDGSAVAVKIQYPNIAKAIEADFAPTAVGTKMASLFYPNAKFKDFIKEAKDRFLEECDYLHEADCQTKFAHYYRDHEVITVPKVHDDFCSLHVLTTSFIDGLEFDPFLETRPSLQERNKLGTALFEFYLGSLFRFGLYNCDPHPGNYLFLPSGKIAMLDHGCTRQFEAEFAAKLANLTRAVHRDEQSVIHKALIGLEMVREDKPYDYQLIRGFLRSFYGPMLEDKSCVVDMSSAIEMRDIIKKKQQLMKFTLPGEFMFLFRIRFGLMSVLSRLGTEANWYRLEKSYVDEFAREHPLLCV
jgi:predicted unusual protein kinase regulating ubiquinone biosynthesis (AarF/ABC1/UbiB family)